MLRVDHTAPRRIHAQCYTVFPLSSITAYKQNNNNNTHSCTHICTHEYISTYTCAYADTHLHTNTHVRYYITQKCIALVSLECFHSWRQWVRKTTACTTRESHFPSHAAAKPRRRACAHRRTLLSYAADQQQRCLVAHRFGSPQGMSAERQG